jgi:hypothetical protein
MSQKRQQAQQTGWVASFMDCADVNWYPVLCQES